MEDKKFHNKTILITGGAGFIGRATAAHFMGQGCAVILTDIRPLVDVKELLEEELKGKWTYLQGNAKVAKEVEQVVEQGIKWSPSGHIHYLFNNAGVQGDFTPCHSYSDENFAKVLHINVESVFLFLKYVSAKMKELKTEGAAIVNTASRAG